MTDRTPEREHGENGSSLIELVVAIGILLVILGVTTGTFISGSRTTNASDERTVQTQQLRLALDRMTKVLRTAVNLPLTPSTDADGFLISGDNDVVFYANLDNYSTTMSATNLPTTGPERVEFQLDGSGRLVENDWHPRAAGATYTYAPYWLPDVTRVLASGLNAAAAKPVFNYLAYTDDVRNPDGTTRSSLTTGGQLAVSDDSRSPGVSMVEIWLQATSSRGQVADADSLTRVALPNAAAQKLPTVRATALATMSPPPPPPPPPPTPTPSRSPTPSPAPSRTTASPTPSASASASRSASRSASPSASPSPSRTTASPTKPPPPPSTSPPPPPPPI